MTPAVASEYLVQGALKLCLVPAKIHPVAQRALDAYEAGRMSLQDAAWTCNMVASKLIPLVECLLGCQRRSKNGPPCGVRP